MSCGGQGDAARCRISDADRKALVNRKCLQRAAKTLKNTFMKPCSGRMAGESGLQQMALKLFKYYSLGLFNLKHRRIIAAEVWCLVVGLGICGFWLGFGFRALVWARNTKRFK